MILALGFFINGTLNLVDYREFVRTNSLSHEHLLAARHFLQREFLFTDDIEQELIKWYSEFADIVMYTVHHGNFFDIRHEDVYFAKWNNSLAYGEEYLQFMKDTVLPRIVDFQSLIRQNIRL